MPAVPRVLIEIGASLLSARAAMRLRSAPEPARQQENVFHSLIQNLSRGSAWWGAGIAPGMAYESFRKIVPITRHEGHAPQIARMMRGEPDVLWPGCCQIYANTAGTTAHPKQVPVTEAMLDHFRRAYLDSLLWYTVRARRTTVFRGRHLVLGASTALTRITESEPFEAYVGDMSAIAALNLPRWAEAAFREPIPEVGQIADWEQKLAAIAEGAPGKDITLLSGMPRWALALAQAIRASGVANLKEIWPNLECYMHGGVPVGPFQDALREVLGPGVAFQEIYVAPEAFIAAQDAEASEGLRLMTDAGVFYEFLPMSEFEEARLPSLGTKAVPISGVRTGVDYALVLTTAAGLARYLLGDIVRFVSTRPARIVHVGRTNLRLNAFGENVNERDVTEALLSVCRRNAWTIVNFHVAPFFSDIVSRTSRGRHEWWVELQAGTLLTPTGPVIAPEIDMELIKLNAGYAAKRASGALEAPFVRLVMPGVFEHWMRFNGKWGGSHKMPRCRSDRAIADDLGGALQFAKN